MDLIYYVLVYSQVVVLKSSYPVYFLLHTHCEYNVFNILILKSVKSRDWKEPKK